MRSSIFAYWLQAAIVLPLATSQTVKIAKYPYPWGVVSVSFDPARITKTELDGWMRLSPNLSPYNDLLVPIDIRRCKPGDREYTDCKTDGKLKISNVDENIRRMVNVKRSLTVQKVPDDLKPIVAYLLEIQTFALWTTEQQRTFLVTRDVAAFRNKFDGIDSNQKCAAVLEKITRLAQEKDISELVVVDWHNCVWALETEKIGPYPKKEWQAFLTSQGIKEEIKEEVPDD
jgi:hypothetical protein